MNPRRRGLLLALAATAAPTRAGDDGIRRGRALAFPRDHGAHPGARTEWWYATGWLGSEAAPTSGFQVTFFRSRTGLAGGNPSRFAARQLLFAHAAITTLGDRPTHQHDQRIARWSGAADAALGAAASADADIRLGTWRLRREGPRWLATIPARGFDLSLDLTPTQPVLLQGDAGFSRKGPEERQASHYYSEPQLLARSGTATATPGRGGTATATPGRGGTSTGRAWLDHEWSDEILHPQAVGWDWIGMNLFDGSALTAFVLRRRDGTALWAGGSFRPAGGAVRVLAPDELRFTAGRRWQSPASGARYPVQWQLDSVVGSFNVRALADAQELDGSGSTGSVYWEGLSELLDAGGRRVGLGYLEMTGYAARLRL